MHQIERISNWTKVLVFFISISIVYSLDVVITQENIKDEIINKKEAVTEFDSREDNEEAVRPHYALDPRQSRRLALLEETLYNSVSEILENTKISPAGSETDICHKYLSKYLLDYKNDTNAVNGVTGATRANIVTDNPNLILRMIRRIHVTLLNQTRVTCSKGLPELGKTVYRAFKKAGLTPPTLQDLNDALLGLLRIQFVYGLNATSQIRLGIFNGVDTGAFLYFEDCMALANKAIEIGAEAMAYQWLKSAQFVLHEFGKPPENMDKITMYLKDTWLKLLSLTKVENLAVLFKMLGNQRQEKLDGFYPFSRYATCRGEVTMAIEYQNDLFCFYVLHWDPYFYINPVKAEVLSEDPVIFQFYDFVGNETIDVVKKSALKMTRSGMITRHSAETQYNPMRTSMQSWIYDSENHNPPQKLATWIRRVEKLTGLEVMKEGASQPLSVVLYGSLGGHYDPHYDSLSKSKGRTEKYGDRIATVLTFLSDVKLGGYTAFPTAGVFARPVKGSAVLWYNLKLNGEPDLNTLHCGCPVILGTKQVANRWILQYENMWKFKCSRDRTM